ncbi:hypothetical protein E2C01_053542 [Portunus trituberculatus]|uniref:Uncharacterized protein n=1 Tax=Portunus trituberculatus TaxID=210409 RepID=A0A5B7GPH0_PORTR|nr:hypothetical protein [Portunus trituberculatus]
MSFIADILKHGESAKLTSEEIGRLIQLAIEREERTAAREIEREKAERAERVAEQVTEDYESLFDFVVRDQFLASCSPKVKVFLREKGSIPIADLAKAADIYRAAHGTKSVKPSQPDRRNVDGTVRAVVAPLKFSDVLLGCVPGLDVPSFTVGVSTQMLNDPAVAAVVTLPSTEFDIPTDKQSFQTTQR